MDPKFNEKCAEALQKKLLSKRGIPIKAEDWTVDDWMALHEGIELAIRKITKRHRPD